MMLDAPPTRAKDALTALLDVVLDRICRLDHSGQWHKAGDVPPEHRHRLLSGENLAPRRLWSTPGTTLPVFTVDPTRSPRLRVGRGGRERARVLEWMRIARQPLALLTNGREWQLIHAGPDHRAFCEWNIDRWFVEGHPGPQVDALRILLGPDALRPTADGEPCPLLAAIEASRHGQAELSAELGERVRRAVETLIRASAPVLDAIDGDDLTRAEPSDATDRTDDTPAIDIAPVDRRAIYIAACRIIMRCVVVLFAEARDGLLPRANPHYEGSYSLQGLRAQLDIAAGGRGTERLRGRIGAWPRLLALFRLLYQGTPHPELTIPAYGGDLFRPGDRAAPDPVARALAAFEHPRNQPADAAVYRILELLTRSRVKVRQGNRNTWVEAPVDFSDLSSEYIGILYEGLLDFELRRVPAQDVIVFVSVGDRPALPFGRLDAMTNTALAELFGKLKKSGEKIGGDGPDEDDAAEPDAPEPDESREEDTDHETGDSDEDPTDSDDSTDGEGDDDEGDDSDDEDNSDDDDDPDDLRRTLSEQVQIWAERAVAAAKLVRYPKDDTDPIVRARYDDKVRRMAKRLVDKMVMPGEWYLVRWGGTRKGSGTFYTRPQLAGPLTRRTLEPLLYDDSAPRAPDEILALKVCDPAMGSGSFLLAALRALTDALFESLHHHDRLTPSDDGTHYRLADGGPLDALAYDPIPLPMDHEQFADRLRARLKRHVVERCIYGVDLDPLAVELARLALWVETMDRSLPFSFIDHKLRPGNSLVGCWFDRFRHYPLMAWMREGGDKGHKGVHHLAEIEITRGKLKGKTKTVSDLWTRAIKERKSEIGDEMAGWIQRAAGQTDMPFMPSRQAADYVHSAARSRMRDIADMRLDEQDRKAAEWRQLILSDSYKALKDDFDRWCAVWFWPGSQLDHAPTPESFSRPSKEAATIVQRLAVEHRFFHWELAFPDVFDLRGSGFDAVVGNPPWDTQKPSSWEFFANHDPLYRTYNKQEAIRRQQALFESHEQIERAWLIYRARFKALSNWTRHVDSPFGEPDDDKSFSLTRKRAQNSELHAYWSQLRKREKGYTDQAHPYQHQGSADLNTYKMFMEVTHAILRDGGRLGLLVPSGLYTDLGTRALRKLLLEKCDWTDVYAFQNERFIFPRVHHSFKIAAVNATRGRHSTAIRTQFRLGPGNSPTTAEAEREIGSQTGKIRVTVDELRRLSPRSRALLELTSEQAASTLSGLVERGITLGSVDSEGWGIAYSREYDATNHSRLFHPRASLEKKGFRPTEYGVWLAGPWKSGGEVGRDSIQSSDGSTLAPQDVDNYALPVIQGAMFQQFDFSQKLWQRGTGLRAIWEPSDWAQKRFGPQFLMLADDTTRLSSHSSKPVVRRIGRNTDTRMLISALVPPFPCVDVAPAVVPADANLRLPLVGCANAFAMDFVTRLRCGGTHVDWHYLEEIPFPKPSELPAQFAELVARVAIPHIIFARDWSGMTDTGRSWRAHWALLPAERLRVRCILDAIISHALSLSADETRFILDDCDHPTKALSSSETTWALNPQGFWRVDRDLDPELRHTILAQVAFRDLQTKGLQTFLDQNDGEGWMLPETLRLADYGLGHDDRAKEHQPVAARLGPRFLPWQLDEDPAESWDECARHAEILEALLPSPSPEPAQAPDAASEGKDLQQTGFDF